MSERCDTCKFWKYTHRESKAGEDPVFGWSVPIGRCRRFHPCAAFTPYDDWCGEYVAAKEPHRHE